MKKLGLSITIVLAVAVSFAQNVDLATAMKVADNYRHHIRPEQNNTIASTYTQTKEGVAVYYIFNYAEGGFTIVSAQKSSKPIIAYSFDNSFDPKSTNPALNAWMKCYETEIYLAAQPEGKTSVSTLKKWEDLENNRLVEQKSGSGVEPLLTSKWGQAAYYNEFCPMDNDASGYHTPTGCVATAMAQIMYYHRYPETGVGNSSYTSPYGKLSANYANTHYDYNAMNDVSIRFSGALATLMSHVGISLEMTYGPDGSSSSGTKIANAMKRYFNYSATIQLAERVNYDTAGWKNLIKSQLDQRLPVTYSGSPSKGGAGHAWVCDGYDNRDYFHMNWGWDGSADGYYDIDELINIKISAHQYADLDINHNITYNMIPKKISFPKHDTLTATYGSFADGSGYLDYENNDSRSWLIQPEHATSITLNCSYFETDSNDIVTIYDGSSTNDPILATYSGKKVAGKTLTINKPAVLITFTTDNDVTGSGFVFNYDATYSNPEFCNTTQSINNTNKITDAKGSVNNGSGSENYANDNTCWWRIEPKDAEKIWISFDKFDMAEGDVLYVYSYATFNPSVMVGTTYLAATYTKTNPPALNKEIVFNNKCIYLKFQTDNDKAGTGWSFNYGNNVGVEEIATGIAACRVYPNPAQNFLNLDLSLNDWENQNMNIRLTDVLGREVYSTNINANNEVSLQIPTADLANGCYFLSISTEKGTICRKVQINK